MLERTDRIALAVRDRRAAADDYARYFETKVVDDVDDALLGAKRMTLQWGRDQLELIEPTGPGPVASYFDQDRRGMYLGGYSLADPAALAAHLEANGIRVHESGADRYVVLPEDFFGTGLILSKRVERDRVGLNDELCQISYVVPNCEAALAKYIPLLKLEDKYTRPAKPSAAWGYRNTITSFYTKQGERLDAIELLEPTVDPGEARQGQSDIDPLRAVARFLQRSGQGIYLASIVSDRADEIIKRITPNAPINHNSVIMSFIHPRFLHGMFLAVTTFEAWDSRGIDRRRPLTD
jgi:hypothetical protein